LDFLGFPWILSSEMSLFNGLCGHSRLEIFVAPFRLAECRRPAWISRFRGNDKPEGRH
jgi:hypothetical protein